MILFYEDGQTVATVSFMQRAPYGIKEKIVLGAITSLHFDVFPHTVLHSNSIRLYRDCMNDPEVD